MTEDSGADPPALPVTLSASGLSGTHPAPPSNRDDGTNTVALPASFHEYRVLHPLGKGAMGQVYLAHDVELDRLVAIKVLVTPSPKHCELMRIEAQSAAAIQHPNVVTIYRVGTLEGRPYIVTEYIRGASLDGIGKPVPWQRALAIGIDLARGLAAAHRRNVLHRDIKLANAILSESGQAKLIDFGLATREGRDPTGENALVGTPSYMAPELWQEEPASQATDVYAMGVLLYELCTGRVPRPPASMREIERLEDVVPGIDPRFAELVHRCLATVPGERHASGDVLRDALESLRETDKHLDVARLEMDDVRGRWRILEGEHAHAMRALASDRLAAAGAHWKRVLTLAPDVDAAYWQASRPLELALSLDPQRESTRALMGDLLDAHARLADLMGHRLEHEQLLERLSLYDSAAYERWSAPVKVAINAWPRTDVSIERYVSRPDGSMTLEAWSDGRAQATPLQVGLLPGSYRLHFAANAGHAEVFYPFVVHPGTQPIALEITRPPNTDVPADFVYVPPGQFVSGFGRNADDEALRSFYGAEPQHERQSDGFLIARHETTFAEWMEYLDACWPAGCDGVVPGLLDVAPDDASMVAVSLQPHREHGWEILIHPTKGLTYRAVRGEPLVYQGRQKRHAQRWERLPVSGLSWVDVQPYLTWLRNTGRVPGARLCTSREWERAARGADARIFPHGNRLQPEDANFDLTYGQVPHAFGPDEIGAYTRSASPFELYDMAGNVWELVDATPEQAAAAGGAGHDGGRLIYARGGSYFHQAEVNTVVNKWIFMSEQRASTVGFRVCADAPPT